MEKTKTLVTLGLFLAMATIFGYIEQTIPPLFPAIPGVKLGLANGVFLVVLYHKNMKCAALVNVLRIVVLALLFAGMSKMCYALSGALPAMVVTYLTYRSKWFGVVGVSVQGAVAHQLGQLAWASVMAGKPVVFYYAPFLIVSGVLAGALVGVLSAACLLQLQKVC